MKLERAQAIQTDPVASGKALYKIHNPMKRDRKGHKWTAYGYFKAKGKK